jgi:hypothetical protein
VLAEVADFRRDAGFHAGSRERRIHLSRRMLEHYSHIRVDAKRPGLDALDAVRRTQRRTGTVPATAAKAKKKRQTRVGIGALVEVSDDLTVERVPAFR